MPLEIAPKEVLAKKTGGEKLCLIDVREQYEWDICHIEGANLVPMNTVPQSLQQLEAQADETTLVVYCHHGVRSLNVVNWLRAQGIENCVSMSGGIDRWSVEVDYEVPRY